MNSRSRHTEAAAWFALCCALILATLCGASPAAAQTPTYAGDPVCYGNSGPVPCHITMQNFGGPVMTGTTEIYELFYGNWFSYVSTVQTLASYFNDLNGSTYLNLMSLYGASTDIAFEGSYFTGAYLGTNLNDGQLDQIVENFTDPSQPGSVPAKTNAIYVVFTAPNVRLNPDDGGDCAFHSNIGSVKFAWASGFNAQLGGCGDNATDSLVSDISHEVFETLTDPYYSDATSLGPPLGWLDASTGYEVVDPCEQTPVNAVLNGHGYDVQSVFVNNAHYAAGGYCASALPFAKAGGSVPEPAAWALIISGLGLVGAQLRGRRAREASVAVA